VESFGSNMVLFGLLPALDKIYRFQFTVSFDFEVELKLKSLFQSYIATFVSILDISSLSVANKLVRNMLLYFVTLLGFILK
jgi:hypothetical protein